MPRTQSTGMESLGWLAWAWRGFLWFAALVLGTGLTPQVLFWEETMMVARANDDTVFVGFGVLNVEVRPGRAVAGFQETISDCDIALSIGGGAPNAARAYRQAGGAPSVMGMITGGDVAGNLLADLAVREFPKLRRIATATSTRVSSIVPNGRRPGATTTWTIRTPIDEAGTVAHVEPWLSHSRRLVLASMTAQHSPLVRRLRGEFKRDLPAADAQPVRRPRGHI